MLYLKGHLNKQKRTSSQGGMDKALEVLPISFFKIKEGVDIDIRGANVQI